MPLHSKKQINNGIVALWNISETFDELVELIPQHWLSNLELNRVSRHNLAARALANEVCPDFDIIEKDEFGKPFFDSVRRKISITHSGEFAGFMYKEGADCGMDMEKMSDRIERIASRFIRHDEQDFLQYGHKGMYLLWCAKETMYKYYGLKALDFRGHMKVMPADLSEDTGKFLGVIEKGDYYNEIEMEYESFGKYMIVNTI